MLPTILQVTQHPTSIIQLLAGFRSRIGRLFRRMAQLTALDCAIGRKHSSQ